MDTSAWSAIVDGGDSNHEAAISYKNEIPEDCRLVVTNYILDELYTLLLLNQGYNEAVELKRQLDL